jgi:AraC-like DNA-binding protein
MKSIKLTIARPGANAQFQISHLGLHEKMRPCMVDRPEGTRDYLCMLFHSDVRVRSKEGGEDWPASSMMVWTPPDGHYYGNEGIVWDHSWFHFAGSEVAGILRACRCPVRQRIPMDDPSLMENFLLAVIAEARGWKQADATILRNLFENFIRATIRQASQKREHIVPERLLEIRAHVEQHFTERLRLKELARRAGWSEPHLCTEFRRYFGVPIIHFILQLRMSRATYLLADHGRRIGEIADEVGYPDVYAFSKMFKRHVGVSPKTFRERSRSCSGGL